MGILKYIQPKSFTYFLNGLVQNRKIIWQLVEKDIKNQYLGSFLGITWAFIQPMIFISAIWFVFGIGMRGARLSGDAPFLLYLISGMIMWMFFSGALSSSTTSISQNSFLVKQMVFRTSMLPIVKILSEMVVHTIFIVLVVIVFLAHGFSITIYHVQIIYYLFSTFIFLLGLSLITSSVVLFFKDLMQIIQIVVRIGFWFTPVFWHIDMIPVKFQPLLKANPAYYLVMGYRDCLLNKTWFWEHPGLTLYFWCLTILIFLIGSIVFRKLKPHFADVL